MKKFFLTLLALAVVSCASPQPAVAQVNSSVSMDKTNSWLRSTNFFRSNLFAGSGVTVSYGTNGSATISASGGSGTVTSVAASSDWLTVGGSPITTSGTLTLNVPYVPQVGSANLTNFAGVTTNEVVYTNTFRTYTNALIVDYLPATYQPLDAQLTDLSGLSYSGNALKYLRVNAGETGFEFATVSGSGDVVGPASATDDALVRMDGTTGKLIKSSTATLNNSGYLTVTDLGVGSVTASGSISGDSVTINTTPPAFSVPGLYDYIVRTPSDQTTRIVKSYQGTSDPTAGDDAGDGFYFGARWLNYSTGKEFVLVDPTISAAVWKETTGSGSGDVVGPASAADSRIAAFDGTTGKLLKDGGSTIANVLDRSNHTGTQLLSTISDKGTLPDWSLLTTNMLRTVTNNFAVKLDTGSTSAIDMNLASSTNVLAGALTIAHATNGISGYERTHVRWLWAGGSDRTLTIPTSWKTNVYSAVPASITNGTITKMYVTTIGDTSTAANQTNVFVSFEFYK